MFRISSFLAGLCMDGDVVALSVGQVYLVLFIRKNIWELSTSASKSVNRSSRLILQPVDKISLKPTRRTCTTLVGIFDCKLQVECRRTHTQSFVFGAQVFTDVSLKFSCVFCLNNQYPLPRALFTLFVPFHPRIFLLANTSRGLRVTGTDFRLDNAWLT